MKKAIQSVFLTIVWLCAANLMLIKWFEMSTDNVIITLLCFIGADVTLYGDLIMDKLNDKKKD